MHTVNTIKSSFIVGASLIIVAIAIIITLSPNTSILYPWKHTMVDDAVFYTIGRYWFEDGTLPYTGLWDLKGPIIYFVNGLGYLVSHSIQGLSLIQIMLMTATLSIVYKLFELKFSKKQSLILTFAAALCLALNYESGDCIEEFNLPLLVLSYYFIYKWSMCYEPGNVEHNSKYALIYGMTLGFSLMTRLTNALGVMGAVAFICIVLLFNRKWKNLFANAGWFLLGFAIITLPFIIYFWMHNALYEMWYGILLYSIEYAKNSAGGQSLNAILSIYVYGTALLLYGLYLIMVKHKFIIGGLWFSSIVLMQYWLFGSNGYAHYGRLCFPALCILVNEAGNIVLKKRYLTLAFLSVFVLFGVVVYGLRMQRTIKYASVPYDDGGCQALIDGIPQSERNSFVMYNCNIELYYYNNIKPDNPYFCLQDFESARGVSLKPRVYDAFNSRNSKWILYKPWKEESVIAPILTEKYRPYKTIKKYTLYKHI